jgi:hypothetical protein
VEKEIHDRGVFEIVKKEISSVGMDDLMAHTPFAMGTSRAARHP